MRHTNRPFDIAIIGGGIACTHLLHAILRTAKDSKAGLRIAVIEKEGEFWRGFPYGRRSSINSLIITALSEFVPDCERDDFVRWLRDNQKSWRDTITREGGEVAERWLRANESAIASGDWNEIYVPRLLYGEYSSEKIETEIAAAANRMDANVEKISACVDRIERSASGFVLTTNDDAEVVARTVVLAIGSPPSQQLAGAEEILGACLYVNNAYLPSLEDNLRTLKQTLQSVPPGGRNVLIVGSNATSLELIYMISRRQDLQDSIDKIVVLSRSGAFPHRMTRDRFRKSAFPRIEALQKASPATGPEILEATRADLQDLAGAGFAIGDCLDHLNKLLVTLLEKMPPALEREFHVRYGMEFTRLVRRAGAEYRDPVDELAAAGKLVSMSASFTRLTPAGDGGAQVSYVVNGDTVTSPLSFGAVFNCAGFENISPNSSSPLLGSLMRTGLAQPNETGRGFRVDERFAAAPGLFVCGPLLAGVFNEQAKFWHVENVRRIQAIASMMGPTVVESLQIS